ncbi:hypothetical protein ACO34A_25455 (plasmid) [Rhizobium sp. ACO-34A]|nr:amidohydrolase family protein [Rhizobium sp. ACO-34A]ATN37120.1 hypothetical protein ACO34A_25455 [Rhizobium sp. ACO-34A]
MTATALILIRGGLTVDIDSGTAETRDILIEGGTIRAVGAAGTIDAPGADLFDATDRLVIPGLVNGHTHGHMSLHKGVADKWTLEASLTNAPWLAGRRDPDIMYASALLTGAEMLMKGCTACFDLVYEFPRPTVEGFFTVARGYADAGIRAVLSPMISDISLFRAVPGLLEALPEELRRHVDGEIDGRPTLDAVRDIIARRHELPEGITLALSPTIPHHCSEGFLMECAGLAADNGLTVHMHVAESRLQAVAAQKLWGKSPIAYLAERGVLGENFIAAHAVWLDDSDLDLIARHGASIAHIPASNLRLGAGFAFIRPMLERGIDVALATDGANSSDALDMLRVMRLASYVSHIQTGPREDWLGATEVLKLATAGGQKLTGRPNAGRIAPGAPADLAMLDLTAIDFIPLNDPVNQLVTSADGANVTDVLVDGRFALRDRVLISPACRDLGARVKDARLRLAAASGDLKALSTALEPHVVAYAQSLAGEALPVNRYLAGRGDPHA